jgi:hypothetical protein
MKKVKSIKQLMDFVQTGTGKILIYESATDKDLYIMRYMDGSDPAFLDKKFCHRLQEGKIVYPILALSIDKKMLPPV